MGYGTNKDQEGESENKKVKKYKKEYQSRRWKGKKSSAVLVIIKAVRKKGQSSPAKKEADTDLILWAGFILFINGYLQF